MKALTEMDRRVLEALRGLEKKRPLGPAPSYRELGGVVGVSQSTIMESVRHLSDAKFVQYIPGIPRSLHSLRPLRRKSAQSPMIGEGDAA